MGDFKNQRLNENKVLSFALTVEAIPARSYADRA
jgi:hypothetical protein